MKNKIKKIFAFLLLEITISSSFPFFKTSDKILEESPDMPQHSYEIRIIPPVAGITGITTSASSSSSSSSTTSSTITPPQV